MTTKKCIDCQETKSLSEYVNCKNRKDGYLNQCKACYNAKMRLRCTSEKNHARYLRNKDKHLTFQRAYATRNKEKIKKKSREYYLNNKIKAVAYGWKKKGILVREGIPYTVEEHERQLDLCDNKCQICKSDGKSHKKALVVDHDHSTGLFRGIICAFCNSAIGFLKEDIAILEACINYIKKNKE